MLDQEKNIKGFSLLEIIVVVLIMGVISAAAYPNFSAWNKERQVRYGTEKLLRAMKDIKVQTDRSTFAYVQVLFENNEDRLLIETRGMTMQTLATKMNDGSDPWNNDPDSRCDTDPASGNTSYWDTDAADPSSEIKNSVYSVEITEISTNIGFGAICFARNGKFFEGGDDLGVNGTSVPRGFIFICRRDPNLPFCDIDYDISDPENKTDLQFGSETDYLRTVNWTRFGEFSLNTFKKCYTDQVHTGGYWDDDDEDEKNEKCPQ